MEPQNPGHVSILIGIVASILALAAVATVSPSLDFIDGFNTVVGSYAIAAVVAARILMPEDMDD